MSYFEDASLVFIPSAVKDGKTYSIKPTDGSGDLTFSRGSDIEATRVASNGYIEKAAVNLLLQSNTFNTTWTGASVTSGQTGYDGSSDAWLMTAGNIQQSITNTGVQTFSIYAKANTLDWIFMDFVGVASEGAYFDISNGSIGTVESGSIDAKIESVGSGFYRCSIVISTSSATGVRFYTASADGNVSGTGSIYIQDAQLNYGLVAQEYQETTTTSVVSGITNDLPRLDYSGGASCPSLKLEPSRSNILPQSEFFGASWSASNITITSNATTSPEGVENATTIENTSASNYLVYGASVTASTTYQFSFYAKNVDATVANVIFYDASNSAVISTTSYVGDLTTEWKRLDFSVTTPVGCTSLNINIVNGLSGSMHIWGAQLEAGAYATSYIPTYGTSATRTAEECKKTGISSLIGQTEGTLFVEVDTAVLGDIYGGNNRRFLTISDGTTNNRIVIAQNRTTDAINLAVITSATLVADISTASNQSGIKKIAVGYANNDFVLYVNGVQIGTDTSGGVPPCSRLGVGVYETAAQNYNAACPIKQALLFKTRLSNSDLAALTSL
jgi:hypothetical protein